MHLNAQQPQKRQILTFDINLPAISALKLSRSETCLIDGTNSNPLLFRLARRTAARNAISDCVKIGGKIAPKKNVISEFCV